MPNPEGKNQWGQKNYPPDDELRASLLECVKLKYGRKQKIVYLRTKHSLSIGETKLAELEDRLGIPTVRKPRLAKPVIEAAASEMIQRDTTQANGPAAFKSMLQNEHVLIPRSDVTRLMKEVAPEGFAKRRPGAPRKDLPRVGLVSMGPLHEVNADGHEKLNAQALRMGDINLPIYAYRDKWSGYLLKLLVLPNSRSGASLAHVYLDLVGELGGVPLQLTTDKGSERAWQHAIQDALRRFAAPQVDPAVYPTAVALKSVHNTVIESLWRWLHRKTGMNLKELILKGQEQRIFHPQCQYHSSLFYWIFIPLIQEALDQFREYWNYHTVRVQHDKANPSGHVPADAFRFPKKHDPNAENCKVEVSVELQDAIRRHLEAHLEVGPRGQYFQWYNDQFDLAAQKVYKAVGSPVITLDTAWAIFESMKLPLGRELGY